MTSFSLATYQPVALHAYPELMRARRAACASTSAGEWRSGRAGCPAPMAAPAVSARPYDVGAARGVQGGSSPLRDSSLTVLGIGATRCCGRTVGVSGRRRTPAGCPGERRGGRFSGRRVGAAGRRAVRGTGAAALSGGRHAAYGVRPAGGPTGGRARRTPAARSRLGDRTPALTWVGALRPDLVVHRLDRVVEPAQRGSSPGRAPGGSVPDAAGCAAESAGPLRPVADGFRGVPGRAAWARADALDAVNGRRNPIRQSPWASWPR